MANKKLNLEKEPYEYNGKTYNNYLVKGLVDGKEVKAQLAPPDKAGYGVLNIVFAEGRQVELIAKPYEIRKAGSVTKGNTYHARSVGANGEVFECKMVPSRDSDKNYLDMMLSQK